MVKAFAAVSKNTDPKGFFKELRKKVDPAIRKAVPRLKTVNVDKTSNGLGDEHRVPRYEEMFDAPAVKNPPLSVDFASGFSGDLEQMIVNSGDDEAAHCIQAMGYGFLNGALQAGGLFSDASGAGIWLAADYMTPPGKGERRKRMYPMVRGVQSKNDHASAQAGTARQMARLMALVHSGAVQTIDPDGKMHSFLQGAISGLAPPGWCPESWGTIQAVVRIPTDRFKMCKIGAAFLGRHEEGDRVYSEVVLINGLRKSNKSYVIAWQSLHMNHAKTSFINYSVDDIVQVILDTLDDYEV